MHLPPDGRPATDTMASVVDPQVDQKDLHPYVWNLGIHLV